MVSRLKQDIGWIYEPLRHEGSPRRRTAGGGGGDGVRRVRLFSPCEKMGQNLPKKLLLLIYIHFLRGEPVHAVMVHMDR